MSTEFIELFNDWLTLKLNASLNIDGMTVQPQQDDDDTHTYRCRREAVDDVIAGTAPVVIIWRWNDLDMIITCHTYVSSEEQTESHLDVDDTLILEIPHIFKMRNISNKNEDKMKRLILLCKHLLSIPYLLLCSRLCLSASVE